MSNNKKVEYDTLSYENIEMKKFFTNFGITTDEISTLIIGGTQKSWGRVLNYMYHSQNGKSFEIVTK